MFSSTATPRADVGSVYRNPLKRLSYMPMVVYTNGSLTRESARDYDGKARSWNAFEDLVESVPKGNNGMSVFICLDLKLLLKRTRPLTETLTR